MPPSSPDADRAVSATDPRLRPSLPRRMAHRGIRRAFPSRSAGAPPPVHAPAATCGGRFPSGHRRMPPGLFAPAATLLPRSPHWLTPRTILSAPTDRRMRSAEAITPATPVPSRWRHAFHLKPHRTNRLAPFPHVNTPHCDFKLQLCRKTIHAGTPQIGWPTPSEFTHAPPATTHIPGKKAAKPRRRAVVTHNEAPRIGPRKIPPQNELHRRGSPPPATGHGCPAPAPGSPLPWAA